MEKEMQFSNNGKNFSLIAGVTSEGDLVIEFTNDGNAVKETLSEDYAYQTHISSQDKQAVVAALDLGAKSDAAPDETILQFFAEEFTEHQDIQHWLLKQHIPFRKFYASGNHSAISDQPTLDDAITLAREAHAHQTDKASAPYFGHLERVMDGVTTQDEKIVAILHDSLEDTYITPEYLERCGYPPHIITAIEALTKLPEEEDSDEGYFRFIERAAKNSLARVVKKSDLTDNMDLSRIQSPSDKDYARLEKYKRALDFLESS